MEIFLTVTFAVALVGAAFVIFKDRRDTKAAAAAGSGGSPEPKNPAEKPR